MTTELTFDHVENLNETAILANGEKVIITEKFIFENGDEVLVF